MGPAFLTIAVMDIAAELLGRSQRIARDPLPPSWCEEPALGDVRSFGELVRRLRRLDAGSDEALRALGRLAEAGETEACLVVTAALLPLLIARCDRQPRLVAEALPELASRVTDPATEEPKPGVANRLLRRVVWRVHHDYGQRKWIEFSPSPLLDERPALDDAQERDAAPGFEEPTLDRVAMAEFQTRLAAQPKGADAWGLMVRAASPPSFLSSTERSRLDGHRRRWRALAVSTLVA